MILDKNKRIVAVLVGQPNDPTWKVAVDEAANVMQEVANEGISENRFSDKHFSHRRGDFIAIPVGVSFGGGQTVLILL